MGSIKKSPEEIKQLHHRYLTDRRLQRCFHEIAVLYSISIPTGLMTDEFGCELLYSEEITKEVERVRKIIGEIIASDYEELFFKPTSHS